MQNHLPCHSFQRQVFQLVPVYYILVSQNRLEDDKCVSKLFFQNECLSFYNFYLHLWYRQRHRAYLLVHFPNAHHVQGSAQATARSWELCLHLPHGWQGPNYFTHHWLPARVSISRKLVWETELGLWPNYSDMLWRAPQAEL